MLRVQQFVLNINYANAYVAYDTESREAFLVDCGELPEEILEFLRSNKLEPQFVLVTHTHYDHTGGLEELKERLRVPVYANAEGYDYRVGDGDTIAFGRYVLRVHETPGHISDEVCYSTAGAVFVGDALFAGAVGGTSARINHQQEVRSITEKVFPLPDETIVYPGHGAPSSIGVERLFNPFFV